MVAITNVRETSLSCVKICFPYIVGPKTFMEKIVNKDDDNLCLLMFLWFTGHLELAKSLRQRVSLKKKIQT